MKPVVLLLCLLVLLAGCTSAAPEVVTEQIEVTRLVEIEAPVEVTRVVVQTVEVPVEVTRIVDLEVTRVVTATPLPATNTPDPTATAEPMVVPTSALADRLYTSMDVITAFQAAGLEVGAVKPLAVEPGSPLPQSYMEATRFLIPSLGEGNGGRVFSFANVTERDMVYEYYKYLPLPGFSSWVSANGLLVLQINSALPREWWLEYDAVFQGL